MAIDEPTAQYLQRLAALGIRPVYELTPAEARDSFATRLALIPPGPEVASSRDEEIAGRDGSRVPVRILVPAGSSTSVVVYFHGGGWVVGSVAGSEAIARTLASALPAVVINVEYRLAPEHVFPAAADDAWAAVQWAGDHRLELAGDVPLVVMGESAGANLAAVAALRARDAGGPELASQVLVYPVTDSDTSTASYTDPENQLTLSRLAMLWYWDQYVPDVSQRRHPDVSPLQASDLSGLPPAIVLTAEHDPLRDEGESYAHRLAEAGLPVQLRRFAGQVHGFFAQPGLLPASGEAVAYIAAQLSRHIGP